MSPFGMEIVVNLWARTTRTRRATCPKVVFFTHFLYTICMNTYLKQKGNGANGLNGSKFIESVFLCIQFPNHLIKRNQIIIVIIFDILIIFKTKRKIFGQKEFQGNLTQHVTISTKITCFDPKPLPNTPFRHLIVVQKIHTFYYLKRPFNTLCNFSGIEQKPKKGEIF